MIEQLRTISTDQEWSFHYGRQDFNNLVEAESSTDETIFLFLDPVTRRKLRSAATGYYTGWTEYTGKMMLLVKSDLDEVYDNQKDVDPDEGKWRKHIQQFHADGGILETLENEITCPPYDWKITGWSVQDVINVFDENMDGVIVTFKIEIRE